MNSERGRVKIHKCTSLHQQSAFINLSVLVGGQKINTLRGSMQKMEKTDALSLDSGTGTSPSQSTFP